MLLFTNCICFVCNQIVRVTHWQSLDKKDIVFTERSTYKEFCIRVKLKFSEEIDGGGRNPPAFRIYTFPAGFNDVAQRQLVDDETKFEALRDTIMNASASHPLIYVWNYDNVSPVKMPTVAQAKSDTGSVVSRDSTASKNCKTRDSNSCLCCGYVGSDGFGMRACHIYEIGDHSKTEQTTRVEKLERLRLVSINDLGNLITLCEKCHPAFDSHKLGIHPTEHTWIVTNALRKVVNTAPSGVRFVKIHGTKVPFATRFIPPTEVLEERMSHFLGENSGNHYCHLCVYVDINKSKFDKHVGGCALKNASALAKKFSAVGLK